MEALREYILLHDLVLSPAQFELAADLYERDMITNYESVERRVFLIFAGNKKKERDCSRNRYFVRCRLCEEYHSSDKSKFCRHIKSHFSKGGENLKNVL